MSPRWMKVMRDARAAQGRLSMIALALVVSLTAVVTMLSAWTVLRHEVPRSYNATIPASAQLTLDRELTPELLDAVRRMPNVAFADRGTTQRARLDIGGGEWMPVLLFVVSDFASQQIGVLRREAGQWPISPGAIAVERSALTLTKHDVGTTVTMEFSGAARRSIVMAGTVHDAGVAPAWQEQVVYAYVTPETLRGLGVSAPLDRLRIVVRNGADDVESIERTVENVSAALVAAGVTIVTASVPPPMRHPHQSQMNAVVTMLLAFSLLTLVLGALLTSAIVSGLLAQHIRQIAMMKAVGATSAQIATLYLALVGAVSGIALSIGLPMGVLLGRSLLGVIAELLNLRIESVALPWWVYAVAIALGLVPPLVAAGFPVWRATRVTVRDALDDFGARGVTGAGHGVLRKVVRLSFRDAAVTMALRNMLRRRGRLVMTTSLLAGAGAMCIASLDLRAAWVGTVAEARADRHFVAEVRLEQSQPAGVVMAVVARVPGVRGAESWANRVTTRLRADSSELVHTYPDGGHGSTALRSAPPDTRLIAHRMSEGRWLAAGDSDAVVLNSMARSGPFADVHLGAYVTLVVNKRPHRFRLVGVMREPLTGGTAFVVPASFERMTGLPAATNAFRFDVTDPSATGAVTRNVVQALNAQGMVVRAVLPESRVVDSQGGHVYILVFALGFIAAMMAIVGLIGLASSLGVSVLERTREFGVMRALGSSERFIVRSVIAEGVLTAMLSVVVAVAVSRVLSLTVGTVLASISAQALDLRLSLAGAGAWTAGLVVAAAVVSVVPAMRASRLTVRDALVFV